MAVAVADDWERWEAELRDTSAAEGTTFVVLVGSPSIGKTALLSRLLQTVSPSGVDIAAKTIRDYGRAGRSTTAIRLLLASGEAPAASLLWDTSGRRYSGPADCRQKHFWRIEANEQARRTPDDLAVAMRFDQYERRTRTGRYRPTGWALIIDLHRRPVDDRTSWIRIVDLLKFLLFCARKLVIHTPVGQDPEPSEPPGRLVASTGRPPRGPDCEQEPTDLFTAGEFASV